LHAVRAKARPAFVQERLCICWVPPACMVAFAVVSTANQRSIYFLTSYFWTSVRDFFYFFFFSLSAGVGDSLLVPSSGPVCPWGASAWRASASFARSTAASTAPAGSAVIAVDAASTVPGAILASCAALVSASFVALTLCVCLQDSPLEWPVVQPVLCLITDLTSAAAEGWDMSEGTEKRTAPHLSTVSAAFNTSEMIEAENTDRFLNVSVVGSDSGIPVARWRPDDSKRLPGHPLTDADAALLTENAAPSTAPLTISEANFLPTENASAHAVHEQTDPDLLAKQRQPQHQPQHQQYDFELADVSVLTGLTKAQTADRCIDGFSCHATRSIAAGVVALYAFVGIALAFSSGVDPAFAPGPLSRWAAFAVAGAVALAAWSFLRVSPTCRKASSLFWSRSDCDRQQWEQRQQQQQPLRMRGWWGEASLLRGMCFVLVVISAYGFQPADRTALKTAVESWCSNSVTATTTYGDINSWDVRTCLCTHSL